MIMTKIFENWTKIRRRVTSKQNDRNAYHDNSSSAVFHENYKYFLQGFLHEFLYKL